MILRWKDIFVAIQILAVSLAALYVAETLPAGKYSLTIFYATMVIAAGFAVNPRNNTPIFILMFVLMAIGYFIDETSDWVNPRLVMVTNFAIGGLLITFCADSASNANKYIAGILIAKGLLGFVAIFTDILASNGVVYARTLSFMSICEWILFANLAIRRGQKIESTRKAPDMFTLKLAALGLWLETRTTRHKRTTSGLRRESRT